MAETVLVQLDEPGKIAKLVGRLTRALMGADEGSRYSFLPGSPIPQWKES